MRILIVEDEKELADGLSAILERESYSVDTVYDGISGLDYILSNIYDLIILDIMLPKLNGLDILKNIREAKVSTPVLLLTAKSEIEDKIKGLDIGADDYLTKPFDTREFLARVRACSRRREEYIESDQTLGDLTLNRKTQEMRCGANSIKMGHMEYQLMECLIFNKNYIVPKDTLIEKVWGPKDKTVYNHLEVYISFLRKKLKHIHSSVQIKTTKNVGYSLEEEGKLHD